MMEPDSPGLNPRSPTYWVGDMDKVVSLSFSHCKMGMVIGYYLLELH